MPLTQSYRITLRTTPKAKEFTSIARRTRTRRGARKTKQEKARTKDTKGVSRAARVLLWRLAFRENIRQKRCLWSHGSAFLLCFFFFLTVALGVGRFFSSPDGSRRTVEKKRKFPPHPSPQENRLNSTKGKQTHPLKTSILTECFFGTSTATTTPHTHLCNFVHELVFDELSLAPQILWGPCCLLRCSTVCQAIESSCRTSQKVTRFTKGLSSKLGSTKRAHGYNCTCGASREKQGKRQENPVDRQTVMTRVMSITKLVCLSKLILC